MLLRRAYEDEPQGHALPLSDPESTADSLAASGRLAQLPKLSTSELKECKPIK